MKRIVGLIMVMAIFLTAGHMEVFAVGNGNAERVDLSDIKVELDFVIMTKGEDIPEVVKEDNLNTADLKDNQSYEPRLKIKNLTDSVLYPSVTAVINDSPSSWTVKSIEPGKWRAYAAGAYRGAGTYQYSFYIDGREVASGKYTVHERVAKDDYPSVVPNNSKTAGNSYYVIGGGKETFENLYKIMCVNLDLRSHPVEIGYDDTWGNKYGSGDQVVYEVIKDDGESYEYIGFVCANGQLSNKKYIIRSWHGYHEHGEEIQMMVYYTTEGKYVGNIKRDLTNDLSNSSSHSPYFLPSEGTHNLK